MKIFSVFLLALFLGGSAFATDLQDVSFDGSLQMRAEGKREYLGTTEIDSYSNSQFRIRFNTDFQATEDLRIRVTPQAAKVFGGDESGAVTSGTTTHSALDFYESYFDLNISKSLSVKVGRQVLSYGDELIIGALGWANTARSFDAVKFNYDIGSFDVDLFYSKISDNGTTFNEGDDTNFYGLYSNFSLGQQDLDFYVLHKKHDPNDSILAVNSVGTRLESDAYFVNYELEGTYQSGSNVGDGAYQVYAKASVPVFDSHKFFLDYAIAGKNYRQHFPTAHKFLGIADKFGRRNIQQYGLGGVVGLGERAKLVFHYFRFERNDTDASMYKLNGRTSWASSGNASEVGDELDVILKLSDMNNLHYQLGASYFIPGKYMKDQSFTDDTTFTYLQVSTKF